jgi:flagella basal body P-ring formation protein FlgA
VRLKPSVTLAPGHVRLGHAADVTDPSPQRAAALKDLDLAEFKGGELTLTRSLIEIRLQLAGYDSSDVAMTGADQIVIGESQSVALTDMAVEQAVYRALCQQYEVPRDDLQVKLASPFIGPWLSSADQKKSVCLELMPTPQLPLGRVQLTLRLLDGERVLAARPAAFEISRRQTVVVAMSSLDRGAILTANHVREEVRFVDGALDQLTVGQVTDRKLLTPLRPGDVLTLRHVGEPAVAESPVLIQAREPVRLVARKNGLKVVIPVAEALQSGREGQLVRVRNLQSNQVVTGRVVGRGEVEVPMQ